MDLRQWTQPQTLTITDIKIVKDNYMQRKNRTNFAKEKNRGTAMIVAIIRQCMVVVVFCIFAACKYALFFVFNAPGDTGSMPGAFRVNDQY